MNTVDYEKGSDQRIATDADRVDATRNLENAGKLLDQLAVEINADSKAALDETALQMSMLGDECLDDFRKLQARAEDALGEVQQTFSKATETIGLLGNHLRNR